ncbi:putative GAMM1 protein [Rhizoclosmatium globosum]|uniref:Putative GAMM1 protein n=1 Tax=Rhizoclosmatium globosum TaxID=329046 RepID=A0A1Y2BY56_9FUNG|nr:putative GAMM1 protein [Rhizoclosmatium globosum]|eukprot:ORY39577.1 putative GAMM1 protein [Rhizoclosmatium globosum]
MSPTIVTHSGTFHADETLAVFLLRQTSQFKDAPVTRTRDEAVINAGSVVVDVGGTYEPSKHRYDHHQRGFEETFDDKHSIKLSSAGLVYKHFGREVIANILGWNLTDPRLELVYQKTYDDFIEGFDGVDNGVSQYPADLRPKYRDGTSISSRVAKLNPWWNQESSDAILLEVSLTGTEFTERVQYTALAWLPAREIVETGLANRHKVHPSGKIIAFDQFCPWKEHLHLLEQEHSIKDSDAPYTSFTLMTVPQSPESFVSRKALPDVWRGIRDQALSDLSGIPGCIFVHASGFIGGNSTREGALEMAVKALDM